MQRAPSCPGETLPLRGQSAPCRNVATWLFLSGFLLSGCVLDLAPPLVELNDSGISVPTDGIDTDDLPTDVPTDTDTDIVTDTPTDSVNTDMTDVEVTDTDPPDAMVEPTDAEVPPDDAGCGLGQEECDDGCVPLGECVPPPPPCEDICGAPNAMTMCDGDECLFLGCEAGFEDCDGSLDMVLDLEATDQNGCETLFDSGETSEGALPVPRLTVVGESSWQGVAVHAMTEPCSEQECGQDHPGVPDQTDLYEGARPMVPGDLRVGFSMAWDSTGVWVRTVVLDDQIVTGRAPESETEPDPRYNDHVEFVFDGVNPENYGDPQDHHLFMDLGRNGFDQRENPSDVRDKVSIDVVEVGICRIMTSKLSENYISSSDSASLMSAGNTFGFAIGVNDFDAADGDPDAIQRQHRLFYENPGENYVFGPRRLPEMTLLD